MEQVDCIPLHHDGAGLHSHSGNQPQTQKTKLLYHRFGLLTYQNAACPILIPPTFVSWFNNNYSLLVAAGTATRPGCENYADYLKRRPK